jgi:flagellar basal-body rod protein FlgB
MAMLQRLTDALNFQTEALVLRAERQRVLASNIANADTPGYHARDFNFSQALREATAQGTSIASASSSGAHARHLPVADTSRSTLPTALRYATPSQTSLDNNSVDMNRETAAFAENAAKYEAALRFINGSVRTMLDAMRGPNG